MRFERTGRKKTARGVIRPLGCRELRAPTWRYLTSLYAACPPRRATPIGALVVFTGYLSTAVCVSVQQCLVISAIKASRGDRSDPNFFPLNHGSGGSE